MIHLKRNLYFFIVLFLITIISSYLLVFVSYKAAFSLIIIFASSLLLSYNPRLGFILIFASANLYNPSLRIGFINIYLSNALILVTGVFFVFHYFLLGSKPLNHTPVELPIMLFFILAITTIRPATIDNQLKRIMAYGIFTTSYFLTVNLIRNKEHIWVLLKGIYFTTLAGSFYTIYTFMMSPFRGKTFRGYGAFINPNTLGHYMVIVLPLLAVYLIYRKKTVLYIGMIPIVLSFLSSISRTAILSLFLSVVFYNLLFKRNYWYFLGLFLFSVAILFVPAVNSRFLSVITLHDTSVLARIAIWKDAIRQFSQSPFYGVGVGNFFGSAVPYDSKIFNNAFNMFMTVLVEMGAVGILIYIYFWAEIFKYVFKMAKNSTDNLFKSLSKATFVVIISFHLISFSEDPLIAILSNWVIGVSIGLFFSIWKQQILMNVEGKKVVSIDDLEVISKDKIKSAES